MTFARGVGANINKIIQAEGTPDLNLSGLYVQRSITQTLTGTTTSPDTPPASETSVSISVIDNSLTVGTATIEISTGSGAILVAPAMAAALRAIPAVDRCTNNGTTLTVHFSGAYETPTLSMAVANGISLGSETQTAAGSNLGVTRTFDGSVTVYTLREGNTLDINGTLTIDPEIERLHITANNGAIVTGSNSRFNIGLEKETTITDASGNLTTKHFSKGVAITVDRAPTLFYGLGNNSISFFGDVVWTGATIELAGNFQFPPGSTNSVWTRDAVLLCKTIDQSNTDPQTGFTATVNRGTFIGVTDTGFGIPPVGRGWISNFQNGNYRLDGFTLLSGGEIIFAAAPASGNNSLSGSSNGIFGYSAEQAIFAIFPNRVDTFTINNPELSGNGNFLDVTIQSEEPGTGDTRLNSVSVGVDAIATVTTVFNAAGGSLMRIIAGQQGPTSGTNIGRDGRNCGNVILLRNINFDCRDGLDSTVQLSNASYYLQDFTHSTNNRRRAGNGTDHTANQIYSGIITSGVLSTDVPVLVGEVVVPIIRGTDVSLFNRRNTTNSPSVTDPVTGFTYSMDVRSSTNTLGNDTFPVHMWQPAYEYLPLTIDLSEGTTGTLTVEARMVQDPFFSGTAGDTPTSVANLDEVYNALKNRKIVSQTTRTEPTTSTLWAGESSGFFDVGSKNITVATGTTTGGFTPTSNSYGISIGSNSSLIGGTLFTGLKTLLSISCTNINTQTIDLDSSVITDLPNPIPANSNLKASSGFGDFPFSPDSNTESVGTGVILDGVYTEVSKTTATTKREIVFNPMSNVSELTLTFKSTMDVNIFGKKATDFKAVPDITGGGVVVFPEPRTYTLTAQTSNAATAVYAEYGGVVVTLTADTNPNGPRVFTFFTGDRPAADFEFGVWIDEFNYSTVKVADANIPSGQEEISETIPLVSIDPNSLNFSGFQNNTDLITAILLNPTVLDTSGTDLTITISKTDVDSELSNHSAILDNDARLLMRRLLEDVETIKFLFDQSNPETFFTFTSAGFTIALPDPSDSLTPTFFVVWSAAESKDLTINVFVQDTSGDALFARIISATPNLSPSFAPAEFTNVTQNPSSILAFETLMDVELKKGVLTKIGRSTT